jgi:hypothetical protein
MLTTKPLIDPAVVAAATAGNGNNSGTQALVRSHQRLVDGKGARTRLVRLRAIVLCVVRSQSGIASRVGTEVRVCTCDEMCRRHTCTQTSLASIRGQRRSKQKQYCARDTMHRH